jgi:hypothetical protein
LLLATVLCLMELKLIYFSSANSVRFQTAVTIHLSLLASLGVGYFASMYFVVPLGSLIDPNDTYDGHFSKSLILAGSTCICQMLSVCLVWKEM